MQWRDALLLAMSDQIGLLYCLYLLFGLSILGGLGFKTPCYNHGLVLLASLSFWRVTPTIGQHRVV